MKTIKERIMESDLYGDTRAPRLKILAQFIKENSDYKVTFEKVDSVYKDTQISGTRLRREGMREYKGSKLTVEDEKGRILLHHDSTDTYRQNWEVCKWIQRNIIEKKRGG